MADERERPSDLVQGTLDMLILQVLALEPMHGYGIGQRLEQISRGVFVVNGGSLFPALWRLERAGYVRPRWQTTEQNRRAKYYTLTAAGTRHLEETTAEWRRQTAAIGLILRKV
jgi:transcriptional regulator